MNLYPLHIQSFPTAAQMGEAAGKHAVDVLKDALERKGRARILMASAPSQQFTLDELVKSDIDFSLVDVFHMDDYIGLSPDSPAGFANWLVSHFLDRLSAQPTFHRIDVQSSPEEAAETYATAMGDDPFDLTLCGLGVNAHLAFNDPPADFNDPNPTRIVELEHRSRQQQADEGHFESLDDVPTHAITVTIPRLLNTETVICSVPTKEKRQAVKSTIESDIDPLVPGTALKTHPKSYLYIDSEADPRA